MPQLLELLRSQELADVMTSARHILATHATRSDALVTPGGVAALRTSLGAHLGEHINVIIDLCVGTAKAERSGKSKVAKEAWYFTSIGAEQATHPTIARYHAERFRGCRRVVDVCTGVGIDCAAIAAVVNHVVSFEADPVTAAVAIGNLRRNGIENVDVVTAAVPCDAWEAAMMDADGVWADPSRRTATGTRSRRAAQHDPPLGLLTTHPRARTMRQFGIKLGPSDAIDVGQASGFWQEWIGMGGECRECILWGGTADQPRSGVKVTLCDGQQPVSYADHRFLPTDSAEPVEDLDGTFGNILVEPHAALIASGVLSDMYADLGLTPIDPHIAYAIASGPLPRRPWYVRYAVLAQDEGVSEKKIQQRIRDLGWDRHTEIKKRGWPDDPEKLRHRLTFMDTHDHGVIIITRVGEGHRTIYAKRLDGGPDAAGA